jgi:hypothetical protein
LVSCRLLLRWLLLLLGTLYLKDAKVQLWAQGREAVQQAMQPSQQWASKLMRQQQQQGASVSAKQQQQQQ